MMPNIKVIIIAVCILVAAGCSLTGCGGNKSNISETELSEETADIADESIGKETTTYDGFRLQETKKPIETRVQSKYDTTPLNSEKVMFHTMKNVEKVVDICDDYKRSLIELWGYSEDGKVIGSSRITNDCSLRLADLQYYYVNGEFVMIKKYHYSDGKWDTGLAVICEYKLSDEKFVRSDVKFVEENWQAF